jgi:hypothetical protein
MRVSQKIGMFIAPLLFLITDPPRGLDLAGWRTAGVGLFMAMLWITADYYRLAFGVLGSHISG